MDRLRQRIPFKFSESNDEQTDSQILDEQEQDEVIENLQKENASSTEHHYKFLQGCLGFMILFYIWFLVSPREAVTPVHIFFPNSGTPRPVLIRFATCFTVLDILLLLNMVLHLPKHMSFPRILQSITTRSIPRLPLQVREVVQSNVPLSIRWTAVLLSVPLLVSVLTTRDVPQVLWWSSPLFIVGVAVLVMSWIKESDIVMERLKQLRYEAKGA